MSIRTLEFTVGKNSITPAAVNPAGWQKDHNPTLIKFNIDDDLSEALHEETQARGGILYYRFDVYDGEGSIHRSASEPFGDEQTSAEIELSENLTRYGATVLVFLVFTVVSGEETKLEMFTGPAKLLLDNLPDTDTIGDDTERESFTTLTEAAKAAADRSEAAAELAEEDAAAAEVAKALTLEAKFALEHDAQFIFCGGDAQTQRTVALVVDSVLSPVSENAIQNKAVYNALLEKTTSQQVNTAIQTALSNLLVSSDFNRAAFLTNHPVNSLFPTLDNTNPATIYTGTTWELVGEGSVLAVAGTGTDKNDTELTLTAGENDGEYEHTLTVDEIPSHSHREANSTVVYSEGASGKIATSGSSNISLNTDVGVYTHSIGGGLSHNNMPPTFAIYLWKRLS